MLVEVACGKVLSPPVVPVEAKTETDRARPVPNPVPVPALLPGRWDRLGAGFS